MLDKFKEVCDNKIRLPRGGLVCYRFIPVLPQLKISIANVDLGVPAIAGAPFGMHKDRKAEDTALWPAA